MIHKLPYETGDARRRRAEERGELLTRQQRMTRHKGKYLIGLPSQASLLAWMTDQSCAAGEQLRLRESFARTPGHLLQEQTPCLDPGTRAQRISRRHD